MIITLRTANFSANNVGHIDIPVVLSEWTKQVISKYPNFAWSDEKRNALEQFYLSNAQSGVMSRMKYLAFPMFATTLEEAVQNVTNGIEAVIGSNAASKYAIVSKQGIKRIAAVVNNSDIIIVPFDVANDHADFHVMFMGGDDIPSGAYRATTVNLEDRQDISAWQSNGCVFTFVHAVNRCGFGGWNDTSYSTPSGFVPQSMKGDSGSAISGDQNFGYRAVPVIQNVKNDVVSLSIAAQDYVNGEALHNFLTATTNPYGMENLRMLLMPLEDSEGNWYARPYAALSYGKSLTNEQSKVFQNSLMSLLSVINS